MDSLAKSEDDEELDREDVGEKDDGYFVKSVFEIWWAVEDKELGLRAKADEDEDDEEEEEVSEDLDDVEIDLVIDGELELDWWPRLSANGDSEPR